MFKNPKNSDFFLDEWIRGCKESLLDKMEALQVPILTDSDIPPAPSGYESTLDDLIDLDILGEQESSPVCMWGKPSRGAGSVSLDCAMWHKG